MRRLAPLLLIALLLPGCRDGELLNPLETGAGPIQGAISDAVHNGGIQGFYLLPPTVPNPTVEGIFNPSLYPIVMICALDADNVCLAEGSTPGALQFSRFTKPAIQVIDQHYQLDWSTEGVDAAYIYRIHVYGRELNDAPDLLLGYADVKFEMSDGKKRGKNVQTSDTIPLTSGQTLPVKWKIQEGTMVAALKASGDCYDCNEATFQAGEEGRLVSPEGHAALYVPGPSTEGVIDEKDNVVTSVTFLLNRVDPYKDGPCFDPAVSKGIIEAEGCYEYTTEPFLKTGFAQGYPVQIEICTDASLSEYDLYKDSPRRTTRFTKLAYPSQYSIASQVDCSSFDPTTPPNTIAGVRDILHLARAGWNAVGHPVMRFLRPREAFAGDRTYTGDAENLSPSRIGWGRTLTVVKESGDGQTAVEGTAVPNNPAVRVGGRPGHPVTDPSVVAWTPGNGGAVGAIASASDPNTGELIVSVPWTLGAVAGTQTLTASVPGAAPVVFTAVGESVSISVSPTTLHLLEKDLPSSTSMENAGQLAASVLGTTNTAVTWHPNPTGIVTVDEAGLVTASTPGVVVVTARSSADPTKEAQATVRVGSVLDFERFPPNDKYEEGQLACPNCPISSDFASKGVTFRFTDANGNVIHNALDLAAEAHLFEQSSTNHVVTAAAQVDPNSNTFSSTSFYTGIIHMDFAAPGGSAGTYPGSVSFIVTIPAADNTTECPSDVVFILGDGTTIANAVGGKSVGDGTVTCNFNYSSTALGVKGARVPVTQTSPHPPFIDNMFIRP